MSPMAVGYVCALAFAVLIMAVPVAAQTPSTDGPSTPRRPAETPSTGTPTAPMPDAIFPGAGPAPQLPGIVLPPRVGLDLLYAPPTQGPLTFTPSITMSEEFNDNVFLSGVHRRSDFITQFTPGIGVAVQQPGFRLTAGYNFTAALYAREEGLSNAADRQQFVTAIAYQPSPVLTLNLTDGFSYNKNSNAASIAGISSGRQQAWSNVLAPSLDFKLAPRTTWHLFGVYTLERFAGRTSRDSDLYRVGTVLDFALTPRLTVSGGYDVAYLDIDREPTTFVHTPRVGGAYRLTQTATATVSGGPLIVVSGRDTTISPAVTARLAKVATWGAMSVLYDRGVGTAGGFGGPTDNQIFAGNVTTAKLWRGVVLDFSPRYTMIHTENIGPSRPDINALTLNLSGSYQVAPYIAVVGAYTFFTQHTGGVRGAADVDQNRVFVGLRFGYPINIY